MFKVDFRKNGVCSNTRHTIISNNILNITKKVSRRQENDKGTFTKAWLFSP